MRRVRPAGVPSRMEAMRGFRSLLVAATFALFGASASAEPSKDARAPKAVVEALEDYLGAPAGQDSKNLDRLLTLVGDDLGWAVGAIENRATSADAKPGTYHGVRFQSGGKSWEYSVRLPRGYDGKKRFPVLVLPDHGSVDAAAGIGFWEGAKGVEDYVLFRPVIAKWQDDKERFPDAQFFARDQAMARVMGDALAHLRLHDAVDPDRFTMTGLSQAGYYTWYYAVTFPDQFAGIVPESAGGAAVRAAVRSLAANLSAMSVKILHTKGDRVCPFSDAESMRDALKVAKAKVELVAYTDDDYGSNVPKERHPGPADKRLENVLPWGVTVKREIPRSFTRVLRYATQGFEGRFRIPPPTDVTAPVTVTCEETRTAEIVRVSCDRAGASYLVDPDDLLAAKRFEVAPRKPGEKPGLARGVTVKADLRLLFTTFKATGDDGRLVAAEIPLP